MYYFLKNRNFNIEEYNFDVECTPKMTKKEQYLLEYFLKYFDPKQDYSSFEESEIKLSSDELQKNIFSLSRKVIHCHVFNGVQDITKLYFGIFDIIAKENGKIIYRLSNEMKASQIIGSLYNRLDIMAFLQFEHNYTKEFFKLTRKKNKKQDCIEFDIQEIKDFLKLDKTKYTRYYDLENKIFNPVIKDIEEHGRIKLWFEKIKNNDLKNSKVVGVKVNFIHFYYMEVHIDTNKILKMYSDYIEDFSKAYQDIYNYRMLATMPETMKYVKDNLETIFKIPIINSPTP